MMRFVAAPDSFKGCLTSAVVCNAIATGIRRALPDAEVEGRPMADGGEGTLVALAFNCGGRMLRAHATGPLGEPLDVAWWQSEDGALGVVETARASGISVMRKRLPMLATTHGTGETIAAVLESGVEHVLVGAGGSGTMDGGVGALIALGFQFLDTAGEPIPRGPEGLLQLDRIETPDTLPEPGRVRVLCDVRNPITGPAGAASVYGPQKGATADQIRVADAGLRRLSEVLESTFGRAVEGLPGGGAAGGLAAGLHAALDADLLDGADAVAELVGLDDAIAGADVVVTGEGRVDDQTRFGKTAAGVAARARKADKPTWIIGGQVTLEAEMWAAEIGNVALVPIVHGPMSLAESVRTARILVERAAERAARLWGLRGG